MDSTCCICLMNIAVGHKLNDPDVNGINWLEKLQMIVPELEQASTFSNDSSICECCISQVEGIQKFRNHLMEVIAKHKLQNQKESTGFNNNLRDSIEHQQPGDQSFQCDSEKTCIETLEYNSSPYPQIDELHEKPDSVQIDSISFTDEEFQKIHGHYEEEITKSSLVCNVANEIQTTKKNLKLHQKLLTYSIDPRKKIQQKTRKYPCEVCDLKFDYIKDILSHCKIVHSMDEKTVRPYNCDICNSHFTSFSNYSQHKKYHDGTKSYVCPLCGKTFITKGDLTVHEYIHQNKRKYKCPLCEKTFNTNKNLRTHNLVVHTDHSLWKFQCLICEKRFPLKSNFDQHMKRHSGDKQHMCHFCDKSFVSATELKRHTSLHTNIRPFACEYCHQEYKTHRTLNIHLKRAHSIGNAKLQQKERKYVCHICPSQFYDKQKLTRHLYGHSGVKPFSCHSCDKKFTDKSYMSHHSRVFHNIENPIN